MYILSNCSSLEEDEPKTKLRLATGELLFFLVEIALVIIVLLLVAVIAKRLQQHRRDRHFDVSNAPLASSSPATEQYH